MVKRLTQFDIDKVRKFILRISEGRPFDNIKEEQVFMEELDNIVFHILPLLLLDYEKGLLS